MSLLAWLRGPCYRTQQRVLAEIDERRELGIAENAHLEKCVCCREYREDHGKIQAALIRRATPELSQDFAAKALAAWRESSAAENPPLASPPAIDWVPRTRRVQPWMVVSSLAAALLLSLGVVQFFSGPIRLGTSNAEIASATNRLRPVGRNEMFPGSRDTLIGVNFPSRSAKIWNFR